MSVTVSCQPHSPCGYLSAQLWPPSVQILVAGVCAPFDVKHYVYLHMGMLVVDHHIWPMDTNVTSDPRCLLFGSLMTVTPEKRHDKFGGGLMWGNFQPNPIT